MLAPFRLYGLSGCVHCAQAEQFLRSRQCPLMITVADDDPIARAGVKVWTPDGKEVAFPMLCYIPGGNIVIGFNAVEYDRLARAYHEAAATGILSNESTFNEWKVT